MDENFEEKIEVIERITEDPAARFGDAKRALEDVMSATEGDRKKKVEVAGRTFEIALDLPTGIAISLGRVVFQQVDDSRTYGKIVESTEFVEYAEKYHEHIPLPDNVGKSLPLS